jgi:hypothetical protein
MKYGFACFQCGKCQLTLGDDGKWFNEVRPEGAHDRSFTSLRSLQVIEVIAGR